MKKSVPATMAMLILLAGLPVFGAGDVEAGKAAYGKKCASCHGTGGEGNPTIAKLLKITLTPLAAKEVQSKSDTELKKIPLEGSGKMKPVKDVDNKMAEDIVAFLRTLAKK